MPLSRLTQKLIGAGAKIGEALHEAVKGGHRDVVDDLLESGASATTKDKSSYGYTPLHFAARGGTWQMVQLRWTATNTRRFILPALVVKCLPP